MVDPQDIGSLSPDRREKDRAIVAIKADLRRVGRISFKILVTDLSRTGCRADTLSKINAEERIWITLPGFTSIEAVIRWVKPGQFGAQWNAPLHESVFDHIRKRYPGLFR
ncbi:MAG: PilZ domain-containing protein [Sphingopyxis sp.]